jgi:transcriptional regulator with XRE-family HTH domain
MSTRIASARELGALVRAERRRQALTQVKLAAICGVSPRLLGELESGRSTVGVGRVIGICARLGVDLFATRRGEQL